MWNIFVSMPVAAMPITSWPRSKPNCSHDASPNFAGFNIIWDHLGMRLAFSATAVQSVQLHLATVAALWTKCLQFASFADIEAQGIKQQHSGQLLLLMSSWSFVCCFKAFPFHSSEYLRFQTFCRGLIQPWFWPSLPWLPLLPSWFVLPLQVAAFRSYIDAMLRRAGAAHPPYQFLRKAWAKQPLRSLGYQFLAASCWFKESGIVCNESVAW